MELDLDIVFASSQNYIDPIRSQLLSSGWNSYQVSVLFDKLNIRARTNDIVDWLKKKYQIHKYEIDVHCQDDKPNSVNAVIVFDYYDKRFGYWLNICNTNGSNIMIPTALHFEWMVAEFDENAKPVMSTRIRQTLALSLEPLEEMHIGEYTAFNRICGANIEKCLKEYDKSEYQGRWRLKKR